MIPELTGYDEHKNYAIMDYLCFRYESIGT